jgi:Icc-related predicted phosphoesterase
MSRNFFSRFLTKDAANKDTLRCYLCSDLHASNRAYRKLLNAIKLNAYENVRVVLIAGDLTGKAVVPLAKQRNGSYTATFLGENHLLETQREREALETAIADLGFYPYLTTKEEVEELKREPQKMEELFRKLMLQRVGEWIELAEARIGQSGVQFYMMPGNDDDAGIDAIIAQSSVVINPVGKIIQLDEHHEMISFDHANPTPWHTPREWSEDEYYQRITARAVALKNIKQAIFMIHVPPYDSGLDTAPELDKHMRPKVTMGDVLRVPVGSTGVRRAIEELQPLVSVHGHVHEAPGQSKIGRTISFNAGSEANQGILRGFIIDLGKETVERSFRVQG